MGTKACKHCGVKIKNYNNTNKYCPSCRISETKAIVKRCQEKRKKEKPEHIKAVWRKWYNSLDRKEKAKKHKAWYDKYIRTFECRKKHMYVLIKNRTSFKPKYKHVKLLINREEFLNFINSDKDYQSVFSAWEESGFQRKYCPTIDRIDSGKDYSLDNIQVLSLSDNCKKKRHSY